MFIPPMGEAAAEPTFVFGVPAGVDGSKLVAVYPPPVFAPNVGTLLDGKPAVRGLFDVGADIEVPDDGNNGFAPELVGAEPGTAIDAPVGFVGT
jgi:hypothetical protein